MNWKGFEGKQPWHNRDTIPAFAGGTKKNHEKLRIVGVPAEIRIEHLLNTRLERYL
jgi:hypothetical protein